MVGRKDAGPCRPGSRQEEVSSQTETAKHLKALPAQDFPADPVPRIVTGLADGGRNAVQPEPDAKTESGQAASDDFNGP